MSEELKPCPFCGGDAYFSKAVNGSRRNAVGCPICDIWFETKRNDYRLDSTMERDIVVAWNLRQPPSEISVRHAAGIETVREISVEEAEKLKTALGWERP